MVHQYTKTILDGLPEAVFVLDAERKILVANEAAIALFGDFITGQNFVRAVRHPDCLECVDAVLDGSISSEVVISLSQPVDAVYQVRAVALDPLPDDHGAARAVVNFHDVSHVHQAEQMRSDFVANVSHELRSPLTTLTGFIETLKGPAREDLDAQAQFLDVMEREAMRMDRLIEDLLSLSKVEVNRRVRPVEPCHVGPIIERVIATLSRQAESSDHTVRFDQSTSNDLSTGDEDELTQVFQNLLENALKYSARGSEVTVTMKPPVNLRGGTGLYLPVDVQDRGPGIPALHIPRLTERFYRVDASRSRDNGGTGLGLAIVKHIVNRHRGRLQINSTVGRGSTFTVFLPSRLPN